MRILGKKDEERGREGGGLQHLRVQFDVNECPVVREFIGLSVKCLVFDIRLGLVGFRV
jgi:hypothetical protein